MAAIHAFNAEMNREMIRARTRAKMLQHQRNGRRMTKPSNPPYGQQLDPNNDKRTIPNPEEESVITTIVALHKQQNMKLRAICKWLEAKGVKCRGREKWYHQTVKKILIREGVLST
jgi:DNA invertase Pin-like site-specific DNA recombinase